jgi:DNA helicase-2/ATP-dependent DNA helicase PcrA
MSRKQTPTHGHTRPRLATGQPNHLAPARKVAENTRSAASFAATRLDIRIGDKVFHEKFGNGTVKAQEGNKLEIEFDSGGFKRVLDSFVKRI